MFLGGGVNSICCRLGDRYLLQLYSSLEGKKNLLNTLFKAKLRLMPQSDPPSNYTMRLHCLCAPCMRWCWRPNSLGEVSKYFDLPLCSCLAVNRLPWSKEPRGLMSGWETEVEFWHAAVLPKSTASAPEPPLPPCSLLWCSPELPLLQPYLPWSGTYDLQGSPGSYGTWNVLSSVTAFAKSSQTSWQWIVRSAATTLYRIGL